WSPFVLSKQTESQLADFTQLFFGQALRLRTTNFRLGVDTGKQEPVDAPRLERILLLIVLGRFDL
ncbi:hypothetical protein BS630_27215, partial [Rhizobium laguerreae]